MSREKRTNVILIGERLRLLQGSRTQKEFAAWCGESPTRLNHYLQGRRLPAFDFLVTLLQKGVRMEWFLLGYGEPYRVVNAGKVHEPPVRYGEKHLVIGTEEMEMLRALKDAEVESVEELVKLLKIKQVLMEEK